MASVINDDGDPVVLRLRRVVGEVRASEEGSVVGSDDDEVVVVESEEMVGGG